MVLRRDGLLAPFGQLKGMAKVNQLLMPNAGLIPACFYLFTCGVEARFESAKLLLKRSTVGFQPLVFCRRTLLTLHGQLEGMAKVNQTLVLAPGLITGGVGLFAGGVEGGFESVDLLPERRTGNRLVIALPQGTVKLSRGEIEFSLPDLAAAANLVNLTEECRSLALELLTEGQPVGPRPASSPQPVPGRVRPGADSWHRLAVSNACWLCSSSAITAANCSSSRRTAAANC